MIKLTEVESATKYGKAQMDPLALCREALEKIDALASRQLADPPEPDSDSFCIVSIATIAESALCDAHRTAVRPEDKCALCPEDHDSWPHGEGHLCQLCWESIVSKSWWSVLSASEEKP